MQHIGCIEMQDIQIRAELRETQITMRYAIFFGLMDIPMDLSLNGNPLIFKQHNWSWAI